jgi:hypothetical protein
MKLRSILCLLAAVFIIGAGMNVMAEEDEISVLVDNEKVVFEDQQPIILDGTTLVPIRAVFEKAGAEVTWDQDTKTATLVRGNYTVTITVGDSVLYKNNTQIALSVSAIMYNDRILIPVRAIGEAMDFGISWDGFHSSVFVSTDGTEYRPYAARRVAFRDLADAADFYTDQSVAWQEVNILGTGTTDNVTFTRTLDTSTEQSPLLVINGTDYSSALKFMSSTYAFAVVDIDKSDSTKEIVVVENGDTLTAWFFHYDGQSLIAINSGDKRASIKFASRLFFDQKSYMLSDLEGVCFTDIMLTGSAYQLENNVITQYRVSNAKEIIPRKLVHTYNDNMIYYYTPTDTFVPGGYRNGSEYTMAASEFDSFTVLDMYVDETNPSYIELYVEFPNGIRAVLSPFGA